MNRTRIFLNVIFALFICYGLVSCNTEERKIKKALKECALKEGTKYKLTEYKIVETILKSNLKDSIKSSEISIEVEKEMMRNDSLLLNKYIAQREQCKTQQKNTLYYLASSYNSIINDWQEMIDEKEEDLNEKQEEINKINENIKKWETLIQKAETPIIYYVIKHQYVLDEKHIGNIVLLTTDFQIL